MTSTVTDWTLPYASHRSSVLGRNMVSTSQPLAAQAGLRKLLAGGNAVDAAIAAAMTLTVVEPTGCGIGSDGFAILWDGKELHGLNASGRSPAAWTPDYFRRKYGEASLALEMAATASDIALTIKVGRGTILQETRTITIEHER